MMLLALGIVIGLLINPAKQQITIIAKEHPALARLTGHGAQFLEPVTNKEKFDNAKNVGDLLN